MYWLTGYDTFGYCFFQCLVLRADGDLVLLTRAPDLRQAQHTSIIEDVRDLGRSGGQQSGCRAARAARREGPRRQAARRRVRDPWADRGERQAARGGARRLCRDGRRFGPDRPAAPGQVGGRARLRAPRRGAGRRRARCRDRGDPARAPTRARFSPRCTPRSSEGGGDYPGNPFIIGSGRDALLCRYKSGRRRLDARDQLTLEFAGVYRQYHACLMRTLLVGEPSARQRAMHAACREALLACEARLAPGRADGRGVRRPCRGVRPPRPARAPPQRLRLFARHHLRTVLDGLADVLPRQPGRGRPGHGVLPAHDPVRRRRRASR